MSTTITFTAHYPWNRPSSGAPHTNRPYAEVLVGPHKVRVWCLVDSGADRILLDSGLAPSAGVSLAASKKYSVSTAGGLLTVDEVSTVALDIEGASIVDTCLFAPGAMPLLGRVTLLNAFQFGLDNKGWLHT